MTINNYIKSVILFIFIILLISNSTFAFVSPDEYGEQFIFPEDFILSQNNTIIYSVRTGDSLFSIANKYGVSVSEIRNMNNLWNNYLKPGQQLMIPQSSPDYFIYLVQWGDSLHEICQKFDVSLSDLRRQNNLWGNNLRVGQEIKIPQNDEQFRSYTVKHGDSLFKISRDFNTTITKLKNINNIRNNNLIIGQRIKVPFFSNDNQFDYNNRNMTIVIDPGHGGWDVGAVNYYSNKLIRESNLVLDISNRLIKLLKSNGYNVITTRSTNIGLHLWQRVQTSYKYDADIFVSIHADSNPNYPYTEGSNVYIKPGADWNTYQLAETVQRNIQKLTGRPVNNLGRVIRQPFTVIMQSRPSILVETGFMSNLNDLRKLQSADFRQMIARGIFNGINEWAN
ncbi:MAG: LysM peptidoglycan-binding domain-containing protein [Halanaerobiaceae bacterium]